MIGLRVKYFFLILLNNRGYTGKISFDHQREVLELSVSEQFSSLYDHKMIDKLKFKPLTGDNLDTGFVSDRLKKVCHQYFLHPVFPTCA